MILEPGILTGSSKDSARVCLCSGNSALIFLGDTAVADYVHTGVHVSLLQTVGNLGFGLNTSAEGSSSVKRNAKMLRCTACGAGGAYISLTFACCQLWASLAEAASVEDDLLVSYEPELALESGLGCGCAAAPGRTCCCLHSAADGERLEMSLPDGWHVLVVHALSLLPLITRIPMKMVRTPMMLQPAELSLASLAEASAYLPVSHSMKWSGFAGPTRCALFECSQPRLFHRRSYALHVVLPVSFVCTTR